MSNILQFPARAERLPRAVVPQDERPMPSPAHNQPVVQPEGVSAAQLLTTLAFYAGSGFDHGERARVALGQLQAHVSAISAGDVA